METIVLLLVILAVNGGIATWNAWLVGRVWPLADGFFTKLLLVCGFVQSGFGYSSVIIVGLAFGGHTLGYLDQKMVETMFQLWYVPTILAVIGTGSVIWLHSVVEFVRNPSAGGFVVGAWNSYAMYHNVSSAIRELPGAIDGAGDALASLGKGKDGAKALVVIVLVAISIGLGFLMTYIVFAYGRARTYAEVEGY